LLEKLMVAVRPEFRVEVLVVDPTDPVLGKRGCTVSGCDRSAREKGMCGGHSHRWRDRGRPDLAVFLADPGPPLAGRSQPGGCTVAGCHYGTGGRGLCMRHRDRWTRAGKPDPVAWAAAAPVADPAARRRDVVPRRTATGTTPMSGRAARRRNLAATAVGASGRPFRNDQLTDRLG
jgi:hypothetical protein